MPMRYCANPETMTTKPLPCSCCPRPFAELVRAEDGTVALIVRSRHDSGIKHQNVLTLAQLQRMAEELERSEKDTRHSTT